MRILFLFLVSLILSGPLHADIAPAAGPSTKVIQAFNKKYPKAAKLKWERTYWRGYKFEARFTDNGKKTVATYRGDDLVRTTTELSYSSVPTSIKTAIKALFPKENPSKATKFDDKGKVYYGVEVKREMKCFDAYGKAVAFEEV
jgi:hypothetical protein